MTYAAPLDDMRFVLKHLAGLPEIATFPGFEEAQPELVEAILIEAARFAGEVLAPLNETGDRQGVRWTDGKVTTPDGFPAAYQQFIEAGWHGGEEITLSALRESSAASAVRFFGRGARGIILYPPHS